MNPHQEVLQDDHRHKLVAAGRRFGKTHDLLYYLHGGQIHPYETRWYVAPTYKAAKRIGWPIVKKLYREWDWYNKVEFSETDLTVTFPNKAILSFLGADNEDSLRGVGLARVGLEEAAYLKPTVWPEIIRPMLADTGGGSMQIGTPDGMNWWYDEFLRGMGDDPERKSWQFPSVAGGYIPAEEIKAARRDMDEKTFRQEFEATFETLTNRVYYTFERGKHIQERPDLKDCQVIAGIDFNVDYMSAVIGYKFKKNIHWFDEIRQSNSDTFQLSAALRAKYPRIDVFPDPAGKARSSSSTQSDHEILRTDGFNVRAHSGHPPVRARVNAVNRMWMSAGGVVSMTVEPDTCPYMIKDQERVRWLPNGDVDKKSDPSLTHASDAMGYPVEYLFPLVDRGVTYGSAYGGGELSPAEKILKRMEIT